MMKVRLEYLKDSIGNNYIGVNIYYNIVLPYLNQLEEVLEEEYNTYITNQQNRDHGKYHITVMNVGDFNRISKEIGIDKMTNLIGKYFDEEYDISLLGLGKAERNENKTFFIVVKSDDLQEVRKSFGLPEHDFHITLGFKWKDVFGVRKNEIMKVDEPFLKLLKKEFYNDNESFNFVKDLIHFDGDSQDEVEPISIENTSAIFRIGEDKYYQVSLIDKELFITGKWEDNQKKPIMSNTIVYRKLK
jgi:hypothetical protein